jgi:hypothetical protein
VRSKEHDLKDLYTKRGTLLSQVPHFWPTVFLDGPEEVQQLYSPIDMPVLSAIKSFSVERYQITSSDEGEPRSLRFTFEFHDNDIFEDKVLVKEFEYKSAGIGPGSLVSKPVPIKWKSKKTDLTNGLLDAAVDLELAEQAVVMKQKGGQEFSAIDREGLWQYEKLREKLEQADEASDDEPSFLNWFGFRGAVGEKKDKPADGAAAQNGQEHEDEDEDDGVLDVEIFPAGEEVAIALADDLWPNVMDYFMRAQEDPNEFDGFNDDIDDMTDSEEDEDLAPELVEEVEDVKDDRPRKKQRTG